MPVHAVGKVAAAVRRGRGIDAAHPGATNAEAIATTTALLDELDAGLVFANLIETDQVYGHRKDVEGFHAALREIDAAVGAGSRCCGPDDLLILTADHGCDPLHPGTDHTREHAPLLARFAGHGGRRHDGPLADVGASVLRWLAGRDAPDLPGTPFVPSLARHARAARGRDGPPPARAAPGGADAGRLPRRRPALDGAARAERGARPARRPARRASSTAAAST